jgi:hypothetical protein
MAITTEDQLKQDRADFADQFNAEDKPKTVQSDDEAFGLAGDADAGSGDGATAGGDEGQGDAATAGAAGEGATAAADTKPDEKAAALADQEKQLREREEQLAAREAELKAKEAALASATVGEQQTSTDPEAKDGKGGEKDDDSAGDDVEKLLGDDFGPEFVSLLKRLINKTVGTSLRDGLDPLQTRVENLIQDLQTERHTNHFKAIAKAHADCNDIVESPAFQDWLNCHSGPEKAKLDRVIDSGSADEIIDMLTQFKDAQKAAAGVANDASGTGDDSASGNDAEIDAAEGVRSTSLQLPKEPTGDDDYARAWAES